MLSTFHRTGFMLLDSFAIAGNGLEYWVGDDDNAYGICPYCNIGVPCEIKVVDLEAEE